MRKIELLAPAKDFDHGKTAIDCGADAVYIGASDFGARSSAANSVDDIARLAEYAHLFNAKVYVTLNTILKDSELETARRLAGDLWENGADALIVQDMAFLMMELPPVPLFASTQTFNLSPERVAFLEKAGISRVILERAASLEDIRSIRRDTAVDLEMFVHGSICVCYSGQCYMSHVVAGRSGNRGVCSQPCRSSFNLLDRQGKMLLQEKHLLSVKDLCLADELEELIDAGIGSFKIEGRLKDMAYVKNTVSFYRRRLDGIIGRRSDLERVSAGRSEVGFAPDPGKTFSRGFTSYYVKGPRPDVSNFDTQKSTGHPLGKVVSVEKSGFRLAAGSRFPAAGDGICFIDKHGTMLGTNINRVADGKIYPNRMDRISEGVEIFRNRDTRFIAELNAYVPRKSLKMKFHVVLSPSVIAIRSEDETGMEISLDYPNGYDAAQHKEKALTVLMQQLSKGGDSVFVVDGVTVEGEPVPFVPLSVLNRFRRESFEKLTSARKSVYKRTERIPADSIPQLGVDSLSYRYNVANRLSEQFYKKAGIEKIEKSLELSDDPSLFTNKEVMRTRYCIRREMDRCAKSGGKEKNSPLYLENNGNLFELRFLCNSCEMTVVYTGKYNNSSVRKK